MKPAGENGSLTIPAPLLAELQAAAEEEHRPAGDVLRDILEHGLEQRRWRVHADKERQRAGELCLPEDDQPMTDAHRQTIREKIAEGVQSLRKGKAVDGEAFMARLDAELAEPERQSR